MSVKFSVSSKSQSNRGKRPAKLAASDAAEEDSSKVFVTEFLTDQAPSSEPKIKPIPKIPDERFNSKLKNLLSQSGGVDGGAVFELDPGSNADASDGSMSYGLNVRAPSAGAADGVTRANLELRKFREDMKNLREDLGMDQFDDVPVEGYGAALMAGYGWKEGMGIGRNAKEDVKSFEVSNKKGKGGLGFTGEPLQNKISIDTEKAHNETVTPNDKGFDVGKEVRVLKGDKMGMKGKILEVKNGGELLILRMSRSNEKVKVQSTEITEMGSAEEEKLMRKMKESKAKKREYEKDRSLRVNWVRNHIRVRVISKELKKGRFYLKKGVVVDVVGRGVCDISMDESRDLVQGVDQDMLETALPKRGGFVIVLYGKFAGVYGSLVEKDLEKETGLVQDAETHELRKVKLEQIAEYTGDPNEIAY